MSSVFLLQTPVTGLCFVVKSVTMIELQLNFKECKMQINITGHHVELTPALREFVEKKFSKLERFFDQIISVQVILTVDKLRQIAESDIKVAGGDVHASAESEDMYSSIDQLMDKLERQLIKHKEKTQARQQGATH